ncbi:hypothetical protein E3Q18_04028 [Wallemia mellicola]|nr:hypothetical protein E3Q19_03826 [Wallemia mellicola]TIB95007.1 hypothetical protein E3Q18_04028 [Wallemia mellicola]TIC00414.1 hypothetical protein E3Q16_04006 [Wallemia mellicola]TIC72616.1 hypothetical protein E3Q00_03814 [Wallemia mellicola]
MGKSDKLYVTQSEWSGVKGQHLSSKGAHNYLQHAEAGFKALPFDCCALSLAPFENPVVAKETGTVYDLVNILPYLRKYGTNPASGNPLSTKDLIKLHYHKNATGDYYDPVTFKTFNEHTHIVAIATSGNVFSYDAVEKLNIKAKFWEDLLSGQPFKKTDIITLQDPHNPRNQNELDYMQNKKAVTDKEAEQVLNDPLGMINMNATGGASAVLKKISDNQNKDKDMHVGQNLDNSHLVKAPTHFPKSTGDTSDVSQTGSKAYNAAKYSTGRTAASFTSTILDPQSKNESALIDEDELMFQEVEKLAGARGKDKAKGKAYARIITNFGPLSVELHCEKAPKTCYNWLMLARGGKYNGVTFHRNIPGFMIQGGDPSGTGRGGESFYGNPFGDEYDRKNAYKHDARGVLSMANAGPSSNTSQFFITYRATPHLDGKHTVFGHLVGGVETLSQLETVQVDKATSRPMRTIRMEEIQIFTDPFEEYKDKLAQRLKKERGDYAQEEYRARIKAGKEQNRTTWFGTNLGEKQTRSQPIKHDDNMKELLGGTGGGGVGKYLSLKRPANPDPAPSKKKKERSNFSDFSTW